MGLLDRIDRQKTEEQPSGAQTQLPVQGEENAAETVKEKDPYLEIKRSIHNDIIREMNKKGQVITDRAKISVRRCGRSGATGAETG